MTKANTELTNALPSKRSTVVLLRWVLIVAFSYLLLLEDSTIRINSRPILLIAAALTSNLIVGRIPKTWVERRLFDFCIVLFDAAWVTVGLIWVPDASSELFLLYFLVIFVAAMGESLLTIVACAAAIGLVYGIFPSLAPNGAMRLSASTLLRVPFLFVVALFYGYFVTEIRKRRKEVEQARLREEAKSELLRALSHDIQGPLRNAKELLALALEHKSDAAGTRMLTLQGLTNIRRVTSLVSNLLQAVSIEAGRLEFERLPLQLNDVAEDTLALEAGAALLNGVTLIKELRAELPRVYGDPMQMGRVVTNLVDHAIKYTEPTGRVVVRTGTDGTRVWLSVEDSGVGISAEEFAALLAPEHNVHLNGCTQGTGLGLYIAKRLAEAQGGTLEVRSLPGQGSTFIISFPNDHQPAEARPVPELIGAAATA